MTKKPRGRYHHGDLHDAALAAALKELDAHGHAGLTMERVAKRLGVTPAALYRHFESRDALLREAIWRGFEGFTARLDEATAVDDPRAVLLAAARAYVAYALANPGWFRAQFSRDGQRLSSRQQEANPAYAGRIIGALQASFPDDGHEGGETRYLTVWALLHGVATMAVEGVIPVVQGDAQWIALVERLVEAQLPAPRAKRAR